MRTAADFNREQEDKIAAEKAKKEAEEAAKPKIPKLNKDGRYICANKGCAKRHFIDEENGPEACSYHTGEAIFHDLKKYWSCCNPDGKGKVAYDWDEFMKLPTCTKGPHVIKYK